MPEPQEAAPALTTPIRTGLPVVVTRPLPLSPLQTALVGDEAQTRMALLSIRPPFEPQAPCASTVAVIQSSGPLEEIVGFWRPNPASPTAAPVG